MPRRRNPPERGRSSLKPLSPETPGRIPGLPDQGIQSASLAGGMMTASELWIPSNDRSRNRVRMGRIRFAHSIGATDMRLAEWFDTGQDEEASASDVGYAMIRAIDSLDDYQLELSARNGPHPVGAEDDVTAVITATVFNSGSPRKGEIFFDVNNSNGDSAQAILTPIGGSVADLKNVGRARQLLQMGTVSVTHSAQATKSTTVSFPGLFFTAPIVVCANADINRSDIVCTTGSITDSDFSLTTRQINDTAISATFTVRWIAIGGKA